MGGLPAASPRPGSPPAFLLQQHHLVARKGTGRGSPVPASFFTLQGDSAHTNISSKNYYFFKFLTKFSFSFTKCSPVQIWTVHGKNMFLLLRVLSRVSFLSFLSLCLSHWSHIVLEGCFLPEGCLTLALLSGRLSVSASLTQAALFWKGVSQCLSHGHCCLEDCFSTCLSFEQHCSGRVFLSMSLTRAALFRKVLCVSHMGSIVLEGSFSECLSHGQHCSGSLFLSVSFTQAALFQKLVSQCVSHMSSIVPEGSFSACLSHGQHCSGSLSLSVSLT